MTKNMVANKTEPSRGATVRASSPKLIRQENKGVKKMDKPSDEDWDFKTGDSLTRDVNDLMMYEILGRFVDYDEGKRYYQVKSQRFPSHDPTISLRRVYKVEGAGWEVE